LITKHLFPPHHDFYDWFLVVSGVVKFNLNTLIVPGLDLRQKKKKFFPVHRYSGRDATLGGLRLAGWTGLKSPALFK
jgi:hypothetical protein